VAAGARWRGGAFPSFTSQLSRQATINRPLSSSHRAFPSTLFFLLHPQIDPPLLPTSFGPLPLTVSTSASPQLRYSRPVSNFSLGPAQPIT
jgi:hypothetical protein